MISKTRASNNCFNLGRAYTDSQDIELIGTSDLESFHDPLHQVIDRGQISFATLPEEIGTENKFFYAVVQKKSQNGQDDNITLFVERGIGMIHIKNNRFFLKRDISLGRWERQNKKLIKTQSYFDPLFDFKNEDYLIVCSYIPKDYEVCLAFPHSVLCSIEPFTPSPVELEENTLLGRKDGRIQSIDKGELREILTDDNIVDAVRKTTKFLTIKSKLIDIRPKNGVLSTPLIRLKPASHPARPQRGSIIFNEEDKCFEGFDGTQWRKLKWEDES